MRSRKRCPSSGRGIGPGDNRDPHYNDAVPFAGVEIGAQRAPRSGRRRDQERTLTLDQPTDEDRAQASPVNVARMWKFVEKFAEKSGSYLHPQREITEFLVIGLAKHIDEVGRPLCPCNFYEDKAEEAKSSEWVCACEEMRKYKYCH